MEKKETIKAEAFDVMQYFYSTAHEPLIHCMISLVGHVNEDVLKQAVDLSFDIVPLLRCSFVITERCPYWRKRDLTAQDVVYVAANEGDPQAQKQKLLSAKIDPACGPQLKIYILREPDNDTLCIVINHMICDGAGFKEYLYLLSGLYSHCMNPVIAKPNLETAPRGARQLVANFTLRKKLQSWFSSKDNPDAKAFSRQHPTLPLRGDPKRPFFAAIQIETEDFFIIKTHAKQLGVTVNDMILAAYIRVLAKKLEMNHIIMPCPVDLRKYLPAGRKFGISNLTSNYICDITLTADEAFKKTIFKVNEQIKRQKMGIQWLKGIMMLEFFYHSLPFGIFQNLFHQMFTIPVISFTNLGVIDKKLLHFGELQIRDVYLTGAVKYVPYFQIAISTFDECCTLSSNLYGTPEDYETIKRFLTEVKDELLDLK